MKQEYDSIVAWLSTRAGLEAATSFSPDAVPCLVRLSAPPAAMLPIKIPLNCPVPIVYGCLTSIDACSQPVVILCAGKEATAGFSNQLFILWQRFDKHYVSLTPLFPAAVSVNGTRIAWNTTHRLLSGDQITVQRQPCDGPSIDVSV